MGSVSFAQSNVVGYNKNSVPANSDRRFSVAFNRDANSSYTSAGKTAVSVTVAGPVTVGKFNAGSDMTKAPYYIRFTSGNAAGLWISIKSNTAAEFVLDDSASAVAARDRILALVAADGGDSFRVYKHNTIDSTFPKEQLGLSFVNLTQILGYDNNLGSMSQNKAATLLATYSTTSGRWNPSGSGDKILKPETAYIVRNTSSQALTLMTSGTVPDYAVAVLTAPGGDLNVASGYPVPILLGASGIGGVNLRQVLFYDNASTGQNKAPAKTATYSTSSGKWNPSTAGNDRNVAPINPSQTIILRLPAGDTNKVTISKPY
jgi:uncharacterized protein (TIGR02597 family)